MPKLGRYRRILDIVFFLYKTREDAEKGIDPQGSGFLVLVLSENDRNIAHIHGITNRHVSVDYVPASCIRINTLCGKGEVFDFDASDWIFKEDSYDIAISPPLLLDSRIHKFGLLDIDSFFLTEEQESNDEIGPADDVFMVGLFVDCFGKEVHSPSLRFGHISMMNVNVKQPEDDYVGRSIILDMNSRGGFSGSPVFVYRTLGSHFLEQTQPNQVLMGGGHYIKLLGIHCGQFREQWKIENTESIAQKNSLMTDGKYILGLSGMTQIIPSASIKEVLSLPEIKILRKTENSVKIHNEAHSSQSSLTPPASPQSLHVTSPASSVP